MLRIKKFLSLISFYKRELRISIILKIISQFLNPRHEYVKIKIFVDEYKH